MQDTVADLRAQLQNQAGQLERAAALEGDLLAQQRGADSLQSQLLEQQQANDHLQREATLAHIQLEESREAFRVRIQHCMLEVCSQAPAVLFSAPGQPGINTWLLNKLTPKGVVFDFLFSWCTTAALVGRDLHTFWPRAEVCALCINPARHPAGTMYKQTCTRWSACQALSV